MTTCNIAILGLYNDANLGDAVVLDSTSYLIQQILKHGPFSTTIIDLKGRGGLKIANGPRQRRVSLSRLKQRLHEVMPLSVYHTYMRFRSQGLEAVFEEALSGIDVIVFGGGSLIKYKYQDIYWYVHKALEVANTMRIPVIFHGVGVEGYCAKDSRCQLLKTGINQPVVKSITTRDDYDSLSAGYLCEAPWIHRAATSDSAIWAGDAYGVRADKSSTAVGLGIIRNDIFAEYGYNISECELIDIYRDLVNKLRRRGIHCVLFTNGSKKDYESMHKVKAKVGDIDAIHPETPRQLVETIAGFNGVVSGRLHANIVSYALSIPSVGLVWNNKLNLFGTSIGHPDRFVSPNLFHGGLLTDLLLNAMNEGINEHRKESLKNLSRSTLEEQLRLVGVDCTGFAGHV